MRPYLLTALLVISVSGVASAQQPDPAEMQRLMEQAQKMQRNMQAPSPEQLQQMQSQALQMQSCMADIDQAAMERLQHEGEAVRHEVEALCAAGKRDAAEQRAMAYGRELAARPEMAAIKRCGKMMQGMLATLPSYAVDGTDAGSAGAHHVCDAP